MSVLGGKLEIGMEALGDVLAFMRKLNDRGVTVVDLQNAVEDKHLDAIVQVIKLPETARDARFAELAVLADTPNDERAKKLLAAVFRGKPHLVRMYGERDMLGRLIALMPKVQSWQPAAIVLRHGLGRDERVHDVEEIASLVDRSTATVQGFLNTDSTKAASMKSRLAMARHHHAVREGFSGLSIPAEMKNGVLRRADVLSLTELGFCTQSELREIFIGWYGSDEASYETLMAELAKSGVRLYEV